MNTVRLEIVPMTLKEANAYKGFLLVKCEVCGRIEGYCAKTPTAVHTCKCGHTTHLHDLKMAHVECRRCGCKFHYKTNIDDESFTYECLNCGSEVFLALNWRGDTFVTAGHRYSNT